MHSFLTLVTLSFLAPRAARATACVAMDINWNLFAFGLDGKDWNAGTQDQWASGTATEITASGRPPFDGTATQCFLSQFTNAIYVIDGDKANPSNIHIYDATANSWSTQTTTAGNLDPSSANIILDHDTNFFYAVLNGELFDLDMGLLKSANSSALPWNDIEATPYGSSYKPTMALAQNHIHFLDVPNTPTGEANIFVIHFSFFQPNPQAYPSNGQTVLPAQHGKTASFFQAAGVQQEFVYIPDDGSNTYVINVETNTTQVLAGPTSKDPNAFYFAGITSLVQLDSTGSVSFLSYNQNDTSANAKAAWSPISALASVAPPSSSASASASGSSTGSASGPKSSSSSGSSSTSGSGSSSSASGAAAVAPRGILSVLAGALVLGTIALAL
ncbi:hypothetical protein K488DRAFT_51010 [Vararia minispora EC-137]|uniref:Uncharacterized protein n=1 Tax=Vararia minispora EC-137 TaxID=1314806 RepID=A0ACB8QJQ1_9AGAM|nr:hypothetical protein K488DRAFT_51010 [Vararia minispora EC-137]